MKPPLFFGPLAHVEGTNTLPEAKQGENWRAAGEGGRNQDRHPVLPPLGVMAMAKPKLTELTWMTRNEAAEYLRVWTH